MHIRSIDVALRAAVINGVLDSRRVAPVVKDTFAYHRAVQRLQHLRQSIERTMHRQMKAVPAFSLVLVEQALWTRFELCVHEVWMTVHSNGPEDNDPVVATAEVVLHAINAGQLSVEDAFRLGLIVVDAPADQRVELSALLNAALTKDKGRDVGQIPVGIAGVATDSSAQTHKLEALPGRHPQRQSPAGLGAPG
jgi:hypothetical protein